ncbi:MAG: phosphoribosylamine--glycine ligase [Deltaproteobacteria bacterium]|jgi:phosphoribosylamine--glycine ligase|nr:phosphoribosylamine--glycine ligase [Deltaproteobacteria bacterium]
MRILIIGSGGREHALAWKLAQSPLVTEIHIAPGNGGTALLEQKQTKAALRYINIPLETNHIPGLIEYIQNNRIDFVVPGPELPLVNGISDACAAINIPCFGPDSYAAQLEGSKVFSKEIMRASAVPTADYAVFSDYTEAAAYVKAKNQALVIKAEGLASGKGVVVAASVQEALAALDDMLNKKTLGSAAARVLIEETLVGEEVSLLAFCDGEHAIPLPSAQDHKRVFDLDKGPNTGGMGAYSPAPLLPAEKLNAVCELVITPILRTMKAQGHPFIGVLYAGLMYTSQDSNGIKVLEYNVRFGDPECQPLMLRLKSDLFEIMNACVKGELDKITVDYRPESALCVVLSAQGYPAADYARNMPINGISAAENQGATIFHAGTRLEGDTIFANGGRVLNITALGKTLLEAQQNAYAALKSIDMPKAHFRKDIGAKAINRSS